MTEFSEGILCTESGNATIIAMDHGIVSGAMAGFKDPEETLDKVITAKPDGIIANLGFIRQFRDKLEEAGMTKVVSADFIQLSTIPGKDEGQEIQGDLFSPEELVRYGADAVKGLLIFGREDPKLLKSNMQYLAKLGKGTRRLGIPLVIEPTLWGKRIKDSLDPELVENAVRISFELGADIIKAPYTGDKRTFKSIVKNCPVPIMILGGPKAGSDKDVLKQIKGAIDAGARGVFFGRNVWQRDDPSNMISAMNAIIHKGKSVDEAIKLL